MTATPQRNFFKRQAAHRLPPALERRTHIAIADLLRHTARAGWWWSHIPSGEYRTEATGALLERMGLKSGMFDFLFIAPDGEHHWLELKRANGKISRQQKDFILMLARHGVKFAIAWSYEDAEKRLKVWGVL